MSRRQRKDDGSIPEQLRNFAFSACGYAMEDGMQRGLNETIIAFKKSMTPYKEAIKTMEKKNEIIYRPNAEYTPRELGPLEIGTSRYLVVGYVPREVKQEYTILAAYQRKQQPVGTIEPKTVIPWDAENPPLLVVTEILETRPDAIQLWVLLRPRQGLCTLFQVAQRIVFYRHEFRDATTALNSRCANWNKLVALQSVCPGSSKTPSAKQERFRRARDTSKVILEPNISFSNEILCLAMSFKTSRDPWFLKEIQNVLVQMDEDLNARPLVANAGLRKFVNTDEVDFDEEDARAVVDNMAVQWPEVGNITLQSMMLLREGLVHANIFLEYRLLRAFLAEGCHRLKDATSSENIKELVVDINDTAHRMMLLRQSSPPITGGEETALLATLRHKLTEMKRAGVDFDNKLKELCGDATIEGELYDFWGHYADAPDTDSARLAFFQVARYMVMAQRTKYKGLDDMVSDIIDVLDNMNLGST